MYKQALICIAALCSTAVAQTPQDDWLAPALPQASTSLRLGDQYTVSWTRNLQTWFDDYAKAADPTNVDLWFNSIDSDRFRHQVATGIDVTTTLSYNWTISIPQSELQEIVQWVFRFRRSGFSYPDDGSGEVSSPVVILRDSIKSESSSTESSTSASSTTSAATTSGTITPGATSATSGTTSAATSATPSSSSPSASPASAPSAPSSPGLSAAVIAGVAIGSAIGALLIAAFAFVLWRRQKPSQLQAELPDHQVSSASGSGSPYEYYKVPMTEARPTFGPGADKLKYPSELPAQRKLPPRELPG